MKDFLAELVSSKKFMAMIVGAVATIIIRIAGQHGIALDPETAKQAADGLMVLVGTYVVGQGLSDHGKEAAKVAAEARTAEPTGIVGLAPATAFLPYSASSIASGSTEAVK